MELLKRFFADKSRIAILSVCLLMLSVAIVSALTGETFAASGEKCFQCTNNSSVIKIGTSNSSDANCTVPYKEVNPSVCDKKYICWKCYSNPHVVKWGLSNSGDSSCSDGYYNTGYSEDHCIRYTVTYDANGGSGAPSKQYKAYGENLTLSTKKPTRSGYTFLGWNTNPNTGTAIYKSGSTLSTNANITLYAVWYQKKDMCYACYDDENILEWGTSNSADSKCSEGYYSTDYGEDKCDTYTVTYDANGGSNVPSKQYKAKGVNLTLSTKEPTRNGYDFLGWVKSPEDRSVDWHAGATYALDASITLFAFWDEIDDNVGSDNDNSDGDDTTVTNKVTIKYNPNGGNVATSTNAGSWKVVNNLIYKNDSLLTYTIDYGSKLGANGLIDYYSGSNLRVTKTGNDAVSGAEWICMSGCAVAGKTFNQIDAYSHNDFCDASVKDCEVVLGVNWNTSKVIIKYNANGGVAKENTTAGTWSVANDALHLNNKLYTMTINYGAKLGGNGLTDYNSLANLYITKTGCTAKAGAEWVCAYGDCEVGKTFNQTDAYSHSDFCDTSKGDCVVVLGVNWIPNKVNINYNPNGGTVTPSTDAGAWTVVNNLIYLDGKLLKTTVDYDSRLGENGLIDYYSGSNLRVTRKGYDAKVGAQWVCLSGACTKGKTFDYSTLYSHSDFCDASNDDCTVVLGVNWQANKYTIKYNGNGNTSGSTVSSTHEYDATKNLTKNGYVRTGYTFAGWNTKLDGSGTSYTDEQSVKNLSSINGTTVSLYAQWTKNTGDDNPTTPGIGTDTENDSTTPGNDDSQGNNKNDNLDKSPSTGMLATILVSIIGLGALGGVIYYRKKIKV